MIIAVVVLVALIAGYFLYKPRLGEYSATRETIARYEAMLVEKENKVRNLASEKKYYEDLVAKHEKIKASFFSYNEAMDFVINDLTKLVESCKLSYSAIDIKPVKEVEKDVYDFSVDIDVEGPYFNLRKFIQQLENSERAVFIKDFVIDVRTESPLSVGTKLEVNLLIYK